MKKRTVRVTAPTAMFAIIACVKTAESRAIAFNGSNMPMHSQAMAMPALDVCALMSPAEATELAGIPIDRAERTSNGCNWYAKPGAAQQKGTDTAKDGFEKMNKQEPASFDEAMKNMEKLLKGVSGLVSEGGPLFKVSIERENADQSEATFKVTMGALSGMAGGVPGSKLEQVNGVGDRAYMAPLGSELYVRKGTAWIELDLRSFPGTREQALAIARRLVSKL